MKRILFLPAIFSLALTLGFTACSDDDDDQTISSSDTSDEEEGSDDSSSDAQVLYLEGEVSGTWAAGSTVYVSSHITVPEGSSLTIEEGVEVIFSSEGVGNNRTPIEFTVDGSLYCEGTAENPILLTVEESERTERNTFAGLWGGVVASETCPEMLINYTIIEYTGGPVLQDSPSSISGIYTAGDDYLPHITTNNVNGVYVITNSTLRCGVSDGIYMMGGTAIIQHNTFAAIGQTGGEAVNIKAGCQVDAAYNLMYSPNTNGFKLSSSGQDDEAGRYQALVRAYNNTIIGAGWRRDSSKGGCIYVEKGALVSVFNNLMVNCKFKAMTPKYGTSSGAAEGTIIDYNYYACGSVSSTLAKDIAAGTTDSYLSSTMENDNVFADYFDLHSIISSYAGDTATDPLFVNFDINSVGLTDYTLDEGWDFHVGASSPVLTGAYSGSDSDYLPYFGTTGLTINGVTYTSDAPAARFGAFASK